MKIRPTDIVLILFAVAVMAYLFSGMATTWYPHTTAEEVDAQYRQQQDKAKPWPQDL